MNRENYRVMQLENIGFIGGGQMAEALIKGLLGKKLVSSGNIYVCDPSTERQAILKDEYGVNVYGTGDEVCGNADTIVLAVKPQIMGHVLDTLSPLLEERHLVISIAAGITLSMLESNLPQTTRVIRVMPNTPALVQEGAAGVCSGSLATGKDMELVMSIFNAVGVAVHVNEQLMDAVTGLSGSGPAYCFAFAEALIDAGVREGIPRPDAAKLAIQTLLGSAVLLRDSGKSPAELTAMVTSPGGTTIEGIYRLERGGMKATVMDAVHGATERSRELGEKK
jgi:pyrroline-5-carboxylate reductase